MDSEDTLLTSLPAEALGTYVRHQLEHFFPDDRPVGVLPVVSDALRRVGRCFAAARLPMYRRDGRPYFDHLHSDHYATFLYWMSRIAHERADASLASKLYCLNKALNGFMCMYDTLLPPHFLIVHTVGMMLGKAAYGDFFVAIHDVTVGTDHGKQPRLGSRVVMYGGASVVGDCDIGDDVSVSAHSLVRNTSVPTGHVVAGLSPDLVVKPAKRRLIDEFFDTSAR